MSLIHHLLKLQVIIMTSLSSSQVPDMSVHVIAFMCKLRVERLLNLTRYRRLEGINFQKVKTSSKQSCSYL